MSSATRIDLIQLVRQPISVSRLVRYVRSASDGAVVAFVGCAGDNSQGRRTLYLEYEAYESMALAKMREIAAEMHHKFSIGRIAMVHRLGRLDIGEASVLVVVGAPHRAAALDACRYGIDTLKKTVPIWKKEFFEDGAVWADGELPPVPAETAAAKRAS